MARPKLNKMNLSKDTVVEQVNVDMMKYDSTVRIPLNHPIWNYIDSSHKVKCPIALNNYLKWHKLPEGFKLASSGDGDMIVPA